MPLLIFLASFVNRRSYWQLNRFDLSCGALSVAALVVWVAARLAPVGDFAGGGRGWVCRYPYVYQGLAIS